MGHSLRETGAGVDGMEVEFQVSTSDCEALGLVEASWQRERFASGYESGDL